MPPKPPSGPVTPSGVRAPVVQKYPAAHHWSGAMSPVTEQTAPGEHRRQPLLLDRPVELLNVPMGQRGMLVARVPGGQ
jgi:hypothetical protein